MDNVLNIEAQVAKKGLASEAVLGNWGEAIYNVARKFAPVKSSIEATINTAGVTGLLTAINHIDPSVSEEERDETIEELSRIAEEKMADTLSSCSAE